MEKRVAEVEAVKNEGRKMFATLRALNIRSANELSIVDTDGRVVHTSETTSHDQWVADLLNAAVEGSIQLSALGTGTLVALQKPNKPRGPLTSLRTVVLYTQWCPQGSLTYSVGEIQSLCRHLHPC